MKKTVALIGTLDTKGPEFDFIKEILEKEGLDTFVIDVGVTGKPYFEPEITNHQVAKYADVTIEELIEKQDRGYALLKMMQGARKILLELYNAGKIHGVLSLGGSGGTSVATYAMRALKVGVPKLMVSTLASGDTRPYVGEKDITMMYSVVDISGINRLSAKILSNAAYAMIGMMKNEDIKVQDKPLIAATMFGVTTEAVESAREFMESYGYEVLVFHATGAGGRAMEDLIESGYIKGVLDLTTTELADELVGGVLSAGEHRLEAASRMNIPQVVSVGALDMVNFGPIETVPENFKDRKLYAHNSTVTLMRTTIEENKKLGEILSKKLNKSNGKTALYLPVKGISAIDKENMIFEGKEEDKALFESIRLHLDKEKVEIVEMKNHINDREFALAMARKLISMINK